MGGMTQDVEKPGEIPVMRNLGLGLHAEETTQCGIATQFGEADVLRGMPQKRG